MTRSTSSRRAAAIALAVSLSASLAGCTRDDDSQQPAAQVPPAKTLHFTAIPDQNSTELAEKFAPLARHLQQALGVPVEYVPAHDYPASVEMFKNGDVQLAWYGGLTGVQARQAVPGARAIAQGDVDANYYSYFIAHVDTGLERSADLPADIGRFKFSFGSESSTSGRLMPEFFLREATGKAPAELFASPAGFSGSHDKTIELVESGQYEIGAVNYKVYDQRVAEGKTDPAICKVIWQSPTYADYNWTAHPSLDADFGAGFTERLQAALVAIDDPQLLAALPRDRLVPASNEAFEALARVAAELDMLR